jgi:molybdopterin synthase sulfur carrier subunit
MLIEVRFYATLRDIVGKKTIDVEIDLPASARDLVEAVVTDFPAMRSVLLDSNGEFLSYMKFFINGRDAIYLEDKMNTLVQSDDKLDIFPPVGGG